MLSKKPVSPTWIYPLSFVVKIKWAWASSWDPSTDLIHSKSGPFPIKLLHLEGEEEPPLTNPSSCSEFSDWLACDSLLLSEFSDWFPCESLAPEFSVWLPSDWLVAVSLASDWLFSSLDEVSLEEESCDERFSDKIEESSFSEPEQEIKINVTINPKKKYFILN